MLLYVKCKRRFNEGWLVGWFMKELTQNYPSGMRLG